MHNFVVLVSSGFSFFASFLCVTSASLYEYRFIEFGRGKAIPLTPDSSTDQPAERSNTGKIVVKKRIAKPDMTPSSHHSSTTASLLFHQQQQIQQQLQFGAVGSGANSTINGRQMQMQRNKKGRLYSLGGNEPAKRPRGRLDRLKTVGTFDLGTEMSVLSDLARNLNERIVDGAVAAQTMAETKLDDVTELSTPSSGGRKNVCSPVKVRRINRLEGRRGSGSTPTSDHGGSAAVRSQHSADDCLERKDKRTEVASSGKFRSLSSGCGYDAIQKLALTTVDIELEPLKLAHELKNIDKSHFRKLLIEEASLDSNKCLEEVQSEVKSQRSRESDNDSNKIELDMCSVEDVHKCDDEDVADDFVVRNQFSNRTSQKPVLRKSKRIVRSDSEFFDEAHLEARHEIVLQPNHDIQIHNEPDYGTPEPVEPLQQPRNRSSTATSSTTFGSRKESSDLDDIVCSPKDPFVYKSTDESSRNMSTDDIDTVFSDNNDLEQLERDYRELVRESRNLQREYKSDGDSLDEVGKKRNEYITWKNQSFENDFELYQKTPSGGNAGKFASEMCSPDSRITSTSNSSETGSYKNNNVGRTEDGTKFPFKIKPILKTTSSKESAANSSSPMTSPTLGARADAVRPTQLEIDAGDNKDPTKQSLFEKRFGKIRKINNLLKCKRFSTSALYDAKKKPTAQQLSEEASATTTSPADAKPRENYMSSACKTLRSKFSPGKSSCPDDSKSSIYSSKLSLFNYKSGRLFALGKSSMFSSASRSNSELNAPAPTPRTRTTEFSKSNTELHHFTRSTPSPRYTSTKRPSNPAAKLLLQKNNSAACLNKQPLHSPLSEEFYNPTGSVRLSAIELYEKFCSADFGGLYKHEVTMNMERRGGTCHEYKNLHEYRLGQRGLGVVAPKFNRIDHSRLLRQKSEPKFSFRNDDFAEEDDEEDVEEDVAQDEYDDYEDEYEDEYDEEEGDYYEDEEEEEVEEEEEEVVHESESPQDVIVSKKSPDEPFHMIDSSSEVDEIFLMPARSKCTDDYEEYGFENKKFSLEQTRIGRASSTETGLDQIVDQFDRSRRKLSMSQEVRTIDRFGSDEILTIYKICSKDDMLNMKDSPVIYTKQPCRNDRTRSVEDEAAAGPSSLETAVQEYVRNAAPDMEVLQLTDKMFTTNGVTLKPLERSESIDLLSGSSGTIRSGSTFTEYAFDTVRNLHMNSCSSTSKMSLSIKSEIFDEYILTPDPADDAIVKPSARSCDFEDFTLTPDGSTHETERKTSTGSVVGQHSFTSQDAVDIVDKFLAREHQLRMEGATGASIESTDDEDDTSNAENVSAFTSEITKEFDLLFTRAEEASTNTPNTATTIQTPSQQTPSTNVPLHSAMTSPIPPSSPSCTSPSNLDPFANRMPTRYSMQRLEPYPIDDDQYPTDSLLTYHGNNNHGSKVPVSCSVPPNNIHAPSASSEYCRVLDVTAGDSATMVVTAGVPLLRRRVVQKLRTNRSQSLGNLHNRTRCFPL